MPCRRINSARTPGGSGMPGIRAWTYSGGTFKRGAVMIIAANIASEAAANPVANILGVALQDVDTNLGFGAANSPLQVTGRNTTLSLAQANRMTVFSGALTNNTDVLITPVLGDVGNTHGVRKRAADSIWTVDQTATDCLKVDSYDLDQTDKPVFFKFLEAALAMP